MEEGKIINTRYVRIVARIGYYLKSNNIASIYKYKCPTFAAAEKGNIELFSHSLEHMGSLCGHKNIECLCTLPNRILASGSWDKTIKIWEIEKRALMCTLCGHNDIVYVVCYIREGLLVSGSRDNCLVIWSKSQAGCTTYSLRERLTGHRSTIRGIIRINKREIMSGEENGNLRMWDIDQGICIRHIKHAPGDHLIQMKQHLGEVLVSYWNGKVRVWGTANNWRNPIKKFSVCFGDVIEILSDTLLLRGGVLGQLEFIDYSQVGCELPPIIQQMHINAMQRITKNLVLITSLGRYLKVIDPISRKCYLTFKKVGGRLSAIVYFY